jgi:hypothetical protein
MVMFSRYFHEFRSAVERRRAGLAAELAAHARAWRLPPVAAWFRVSLATPPSDLRFAWPKNSAVHSEFMNFRELRIIAGQMAKPWCAILGLK